MGLMESGLARGFERHGPSISLDQAATLLGVSRRTIYNWIREGRLQTVRIANRSQRVLIASVNDSRERESRERTWFNSGEQNRAMNQQ